MKTLDLPQLARLPAPVSLKIWIFAMSVDAVSIGASVAGALVIVVSLATVAFDEESEKVGASRAMNWMK